MEDQRHNNQDEKKSYTPEGDKNEVVKNESKKPTQNLKWDQAQRRQQAGPRSYNESVDSQNISNQNTDADNEQIENEGDDPNNPKKKIGDQISERQQIIDKKNAPGNRKDDSREEK